MIVDGVNHQSSTVMAVTLMGQEDLAGGSCRRGNAFVELGRSQFVQSSRFWLVVAEGLSVVGRGYPSQGRLLLVHPFDFSMYLYVM